MLLKVVKTLRLGQFCSMLLALLLMDRLGPHHHLTLRDVLIMSATWLLMAAFMEGVPWLRKRYPHGAWMAQRHRGKRGVAQPEAVFEEEGVWPPPPTRLR